MSNETKKPTYWRSFDELAQSETEIIGVARVRIRTSLEPLGSGQTRRHFLGIMRLNGDDWSDRLSASP